jgi:EAL domain-containing protein (putative c-di-GMP-specific phosphodiesterase class I)
MVKITKKFKKQFGKLVFSTGNNTLAVILDDAADLQETEKYFVEFFHKPIKSNQMSVDVNVNVYVLECPKYANNANDVFKITQHIADYFKNIGEDKVVYINEEILLKTQRIESIKAILVEAIENNGFDVMYQPIYDIKSNCFASAEALVRLSYTGDFGFISPEEYIPIAEKNGLISKIGAIVFKKVCRFASVNNISKLGVKYIEVNLSGVQAADSNISVQLKEIMDSYGIGPGFINLEITETALIDYQDILCDNMSKLRAIGCTFSMDDFGTGYSNISQLTELNYDIIKIDKSLVWPCFDEYNYNIRSSRIVLDNIVSLIQQINARIVVEGIETKEQFDYMKKLGVDYIQGYYFSKPLKENDYISYLEKNKIGARSAN